MPNRTEARPAKAALTMPPGDYRYCACSRLHSSSGSTRVMAWFQHYRFQHYRLLSPLQRLVLLTVSLVGSSEYICIRRNSISTSVDEAKCKAHRVMRIGTRNRKEPEMLAVTSFIGDPQQLPERAALPLLSRPKR